MLVQYTPTRKNVTLQMIIWKISTLKMSMGKLSTRKTCIFSLQRKMIPYPSPALPVQHTPTTLTPSSIHTHTHTHVCTTYKNKKQLIKTRLSFVNRNQPIFENFEYWSHPQNLLPFLQKLLTIK